MGPCSTPSKAQIPFAPMPCAGWHSGPDKAGWVPAVPLPRRRCQAGPPSWPQTVCLTSGPIVRLGGQPSFPLPKAAGPHTELRYGPPHAVQSLAVIATASLLNLFLGDSAISCPMYATHVGRVLCVQCTLFSLLAVAPHIVNV